MLRIANTERTAGAGSARPLRLSVVSSAYLLFAAVPLQAQVSTAAGRVVIPRGADSVPLPAVRVLLHRVGRDVQGPVDSTLADPRGHFRFRFRPDTTALYLLSVRYGGIEYFSTPVHTNPARPDTTLRLIAYDTSSTTPVVVEARHIVIPRIGEGGARAILDLIVLRNDGRLARVSPDAAHPSWTVTLPPGTGEMQVGESDVSPDAVVREGDTVKVLAPLAPGQKQLSLEYAAVAPKGALAFSVGSAAVPLNVLVEEAGARVSGGALAPSDSQVIEGRNFHRWTGQVPAGGTVTVTFAGLGGPGSRWFLPALIAPVAVVLAFAAWRLLQRPAVPAETASRDRLLDAIAALDARYGGHQSETAPEEWRQYETDRAALKQRLADALATGTVNRYV